MTGDNRIGGTPPGGPPQRPQSRVRASASRLLRVDPLLDKPAIEGRASIAAPVLAGFSLALVGVIAQDPTHFRWPGATLAALMAPIFCLIYAVRVGTRARLSALRGRRDAYHVLSRRTFLMYGIGISSLWACIGMTAAPPVSGGRKRPSVG